MNPSVSSSAQTGATETRHKSMAKQKAKKYKMIIISIDIRKILIRNQN
jgi:hypothetical protein